MDHSLALISQLAIDCIQIAQDVHESTPPLLTFAHSHLESVLLLN
jgi:hypothetical protein